VKLGVAFGWHTLAWEELAALVARAEALGFDAAWHDGDITQLGRRRDVDVLDGWTVTTALLVRTRRIGVGSIRLVQHWNAAHLAQAAASAERIAPGRLQFLCSIGDRPEDPAWGYPKRTHAERCAWLDETLDAVRALWRGEDVTRDGPHVVLDAARVRPTPPGGALPIEVAARRGRLLRVVARHADVWNVNWPALPARVAESAAALEAACGELGRPAASIRRRMWIFTRAARMTHDDALAEFRRWNPWFASIPDAELAPALVVGTPAECREQIAHHGRTLDLEMPVIDLCGLDAAGARDAIEAFEGFPRG
jgi:alkanesulfonate monooxygenase SsuD/methylene tetrahydromethanopterin reductase-like flavin-dependent oxidoreductase (luciferase family)